MQDRARLAVTLSTWPTALVDTLLTLGFLRRHPIDTLLTPLPTHRHDADTFLTPPIVQRHLVDTILTLLFWPDTFLILFWYFFDTFLIPFVSARVCLTLPATLPLDICDLGVSSLTPLIANVYLVVSPKTPCVHFLCACLSGVTFCLASFVSYFGIRNDHIFWARIEPLLSPYWAHCANCALWAQWS